MWGSVDPGGTETSQAFLQHETFQWQAKQAEGNPRQVKAARVD